MNGLPYYKAYPRDFIEGTIGMGFELKGAYRIVLDLIYMQGGQLPDDARYISGMLGCSVKKWNGFREILLSLGKIKVSGEFLINDRAVIEIETLGKLQDKQRENRSRPNKNKELQSPQFDHSRDYTEPDTEPDKKEEPNGSLSSDDDDRHAAQAADAQSAFDAYNVAAAESGWPQAQVLSKSRRSSLAARLRECGGLAGWKAALAKAQASPLCCGQNDRGWVADLDFLLQAKSFTRLMEGAYDNRSQARQQQRNATRGPGGIDPALEQIARLTGLSEAPGYGGGRA